MSTPQDGAATCRPPCTVANQAQVQALVSTQQALLSIGEHTAALVSTGVQSIPPPSLLLWATMLAVATITPPWTPALTFSSANAMIIRPRAVSWNLLEAYLQGSCQQAPNDSQQHEPLGVGLYQLYQLVAMPKLAAGGESAGLLITQGDIQDVWVWERICGCRHPHVKIQASPQFQA